MKIMVIEDERPVRKLLCEYLNILNVEEVIECECGQEALDYLDKNEDRLAAIFLDINLDGMNGLEFLQQFMKKSKYNDIPVFVITGDPNKETMKTCFRHEIYCFVEKPFEQKQIADCVSIAGRIEADNSSRV